MAALALAREFMSSFSKLDIAIQKRVYDLAEKCRLLSIHDLQRSKGLHLEPYAHQKDPRARTIRLGDNHRGIVLLPGGSDRIVLVDVLTHDRADQWMVRNEFKVNAATGALEVFDAGAIAERVESVKAQTARDPATAGALFAHRRDKDFLQLGLDESLLEVLRLLQHERQLEPLLLHLPQGQAEALILLTGTESVEAIYEQVAGSIAADEIDPDDLARAIDAPASRAHFHVVTDEVDLADMLARPLAQWRTYLHHSQQDLAYRIGYKGPVRVTGGAGTGKTVVAMHRAKALAAQLDLGAAASAKPILLTTFTRNLAQAIGRDLNLLGGPDLSAVVDVLNVDRFAVAVVRQAEGALPAIGKEWDLRKLWDTKILELGIDWLSPTFALQEWEQVVLAQGLDARDEYFRAPRSGRGTRLDRRQRADVWKVIEAATREMEDRGLHTFVQVAAKAAGYLQQETIKPYHHVIVDEAQDLHEAQWRLLRAAVAEGPDDLFIVGDAHQRIYGRRSSLSKVGINIRGRSRKLRINYRTTRQILRWSLALLGDDEFDDLDDLDEGKDDQDVAGYHSFLDGAEPTCVGFRARDEMVGGLVEQVRRWIDEGVNPTDIGIVARTDALFDRIELGMDEAGLRADRLGRDLKVSEGIALGTMHRMKGLEYRCIAIVDASAGVVPLKGVLNAAAEDPAQHEAELRRERSLLYVAATRARDDLWVAWCGRPSPFLDAEVSL